MFNKIIDTLSALAGAAALAAVLGGCATPIERSDATPKLYSTPVKSIALAVLEARPYVVSGNKTPKFEGIVRGGFGIPHTLDRPKRPAEERFVDLFAGLVKDGLTDAGTKVDIIAMPVGASVEAALMRMSEGDAARHVVIQVLESNWDAGGLSGNFLYKYDFGIYVRRRGAAQPTGKHFIATESNPASDKYNVFDMHSVRYKQIIESMFADPLIRKALED
jgi:hypothetical protein